MEFLKELLGDDLYSQVEAKLKDNKDVKLANLASGEYVSKAKYDDKEAELVKANNTITSLQDAASKFEGTDIENLKTQITDNKAKYDADIAKLQEDMKKRDAIDAWLDAHPTQHRALIRSQFDYSKLQIENDTVKGIDEIGKTLTESYADMFESTNDGGNGGMPHGKPPVEKDPSKMSMEEYKAWRSKQ